jgi:hypothetical protein
VQFFSGSEGCGGADIAQEHVGFLYLGQRRLEGASDCLFDKSLS